MKILRRIITLVSSIILSTCYGDIWRLKDRIAKSKNCFTRELYILAYERKLRKYGSWIGYNAELLNLPCSPHGFYGIFIADGAKIGKNAVIFQHVTIGSNTLIDSKGKGSPTIGDNCYIGAGAKIIGNVIIGNNCRIGANAVVTKDVPDNSVVVIGDIRVINKETMDNRFYSKNGKGNWGFYEDGKFIEHSQSSKN